MLIWRVRSYNSKSDKSFIGDGHESLLLSLFILLDVFYIKNSKLHYLFIM